MQTTTTDLDTLISDTARACAQGWAEQASEDSARRWTNPVPEADHDHLEHEVLGRPATDEESAEFSRIFCDEYNARMTQRAESEGWDT